MSPPVGTSGCGKLSSGRVKGEPLIERAVSYVLNIYYYTRCNCFNGVLPCEGTLDVKTTLHTSALDVGKDLVTG